MIARLATLLVLLGSAALLALLGPAISLRESAPPAPPAAPIDGGQVADDAPPLEMRHAFLGQGGTMAGVLDRLGLSVAERQEVLTTVDDHLDMRRLSPKTGVVAAVDPEGRIRRVAVRGEPERFVRVRLGEDGASGAEEIILPVTTSVETAGGVVESSVAQALAYKTHAARLTQGYADIFQWDVDLLVDPRPGDRVRIAFEVKRLGRVPDDLPPFSDAARQRGEFVGLGRILAASYEGRLASANAFWVDDGEGRGNYYDEQGRPLRKSFLKSPLNYRRISSGFSRSRRHPVTRKVVPHHGVDFAASPGTPVAATADGRVISARWDGALGRAVRVRHGGEYVTIYGHLRGFARGIRSGVEVRQGQVIGYVGSTGRATGPHLHYTVLRYGRPINPLRMENPPVEPLQPELRPWLAESRRRFEPVLESIPLAASHAGRAETAGADPRTLTGL